MALHQPRTLLVSQAWLSEPDHPLIASIRAAKTRTIEIATLSFQAFAHCPSSLTSFFALCFDTLTHCSVRNSPVLIIIHHCPYIFSPDYVASAALSAGPAPETCVVGRLQVGAGVPMLVYSARFARPRTLPNDHTVSLPAISGAGHV